MATESDDVDNIVNNSISNNTNNNTMGNNVNNKIDTSSITSGSIPRKRGHLRQNGLAVSNSIEDITSDAANTGNKNPRNIGELLNKYTLFYIVFSQFICRIVCMRLLVG